MKIIIYGGRDMDRVTAFNCLDRNPRHIRRFGLRNGIAPRPVVAATEDKSVRVRPTATKVVNDRGVSLPRVPTIHGHFEVRI